MTKKQRQYNKTKIVFSADDKIAGNSHAKVNKSRQISHINANSKWITDLNTKYKAMKLLKENTGEYLDNITPKKDNYKAIQDGQIGTALECSSQREHRG